MKIAHLIESNSVSYGGPAFGMARIIDNYPTDVVVTIIITGNTYSGPEVEIKKNVRILNYPNPLSILFYLITNSYDLVIVHGVWRSELFVVGLVSIFKKRDNVAYSILVSLVNEINNYRTRENKAK